MSVVYRMNGEVLETRKSFKQTCFCDKGPGYSKKRTHLKITTVSEEVTYPLSVEQRTLTSLPFGRKWLVAVTWSFGCIHTNNTYLSTPKFLCCCNT